MSRRATSFLASRISQKIANNSRQIAASASKTFFSTATSSNYVSPYNDLFETMKSNKPSTDIVPDIETREIPTLKCGISESVLKFRTTCYDRLMLPPYVNTNEYKVVLQVKLQHLPLDTDLEKEFFHQVVGTRFDHELGELKLTCNQFASRIENKRHLCWMLDRLIIGTKRAAKEIK
jgi:hypothetical protein